MKVLKESQLIVEYFQLLFEEFRVKRFKLLWLDSRDSFTAQQWQVRQPGNQSEPG
jgi:hypothetical protein